MYQYHKDRIQAIGHSKRLDPYITYSAILAPIDNNDFACIFTAYEHPDTQKYLDKPTTNMNEHSTAYKYLTQYNRTYNIPFSYSFYYLDENETEEERLAIAKSEIHKWMYKYHKENFNVTAHPFTFIEGKDYTMDIFKEEFDYELELPI